jgi:hypothetical protein
MTKPTRRPDENDPRIELPRGLRARMLVIDLLLFAFAAGIAFYVAVFGLQKVPPTGVPLSPLPAEAYGPPAPPIHELHKIALVVAVVFGATLLTYLHPLAPMVKLLGGRWREKVVVRFGRDAVDSSWPRCGWLAFEPMLRQSSLRVATLVSGVVAIALWHHGREGLALLGFLAAAGAMFYVVGTVALTVTGRLDTAWRALARSGGLLLLLYCAERAVAWIVP